MSFGFESLTFNAKDGYLESLCRGLRGALLTVSDYTSLTECGSLDDIRLHLADTNYGNFLQNEPSPLSVSRLVEKCDEKLVEEFQHMRAQAEMPLAQFLDYLTYPYMIDNVVLVVSGTLQERDVEDLLAKCHPLGMFDSIATLAVAQSMRELYRLVLVDTPLAAYFSACISSDDLNEMNIENIEIMRNTLYKAYLDDFHRFCQTLGGTTAEVMTDILEFEADRRAINITINSLGTELTREERTDLFNKFGRLHSKGHTALAKCQDMDEVRGVLEPYSEFNALSNKLANTDTDTALLDKVFYEMEVKKWCLAFEMQFHYGVFFAYLKLKEQEIRNLMWIAECVMQDQRHRIFDGIVHLF